MIRNLLINVGRCLGYICLYSILPILFILLPDIFSYYEVIVDLYIFNPIISIVFSSIICLNNGFIFYTPILCGISFSIVMLIFYDSSRIWFMIVYVVCALIGSFIGEKLNANHRREIY